MKNWQRAVVAPQTSLREALRAIDSAGTQLALVADADGRLLGTLSDGDARRALLRGMGLDEAVSAAMHLRPTCARVGDERTEMLATMRRLSLHQMPVLDEQGRLVELVLLDEMLAAPRRPNAVVIMAGGLGSRLAELTRDTPKPMLRVGSRPLLETIVRSFADQGFQRFYLAVNYLSEQIEAHFGDGSAYGVDVRYLRERQRLGTAGALSLLPPQDLPVVVTNADLLTKVDYGHMVDGHVAHGAVATMAVRDYEMQVPFGVVRHTGGCIDTIDEKPIQRFTVSAGIYVLSPEALRLVPTGHAFDMPALFDAAARDGLPCRAHPIDGYWLDIGRLGDYQRANAEFGREFT